MRRRPLLLLAALLGLLATAVPGSAAPARPSLAAISDVRGVVYANANRPPAALLPDIPRLRAIGVNHVTLYVYLAVASPTADEVTRGLTTPTDAELEVVVDALHAAGMTVALTPLPWYFGGTAWRGGFQPVDRNAFFDSWRYHVDHYADLAQRTGVELLSVGSEMVSLQPETAQWRRTIAEAREHYSGPLTYMVPVNDTMLRTVGFWDALDVVSVSPYFSVSQAAVPSYGEVRGTWQGYGLGVLRRLARTTGKKVLIAETGYVSAEYLGRAPHVDKPSSVPAPLAQADAYAAVLDAVDATPDRRDFLLGLAWWDWNPLAAGPLDTSFSPRAKPAECVLAQHWAAAPVGDAARLLPCRAS